MGLVYKGLTMLFEMKELYILELSVLMISSYHISKMFQIAYSICIIINLMADLRM